MPCKALASSLSATAMVARHHSMIAPMLRASQKPESRYHRGLLKTPDLSPRPEGIWQQFYLLDLHHAQKAGAIEMAPTSGCPATVTPRHFRFIIRRE
jgi:hypothetical protein